MAATHPITCVTRTDGEISTCYHSFYWIKILLDGKVDVVARIPSAMSDVDTVEQGLHLFLSDINERGSLRKESCGNFVLTTTDGSRYYAFWCGLQPRIFVAVSRFPHFGFSRQLIALLGTELAPSIRAQLLALCETPILPTCGLTYVLQFNSASAKLDFNTCEQVNDNDVNMIPLSMFSPHMLVAAWESILLERKVLLISVSSAIISPCCEFLRRLMLPLNLVNTFVPLLPRQLINAIEAPFPYLCGAETSSVLGSDADLSNIVLIDLDLRTITMPEISPENPDVSMPISLKIQLLKEITDILVNPFTNWIERPCTIINSSGRPLPQGVSRPSSEESQSLQADHITRLFITTNLSLLTARDCSVKAFYRRAELHKSGIFCPEICKVREHKESSPKCFDLRCGVAYGCLQLLREDKDDSTSHFITCWVEVDDYSVAVYQHADQLPLLFCPTSDIKRVHPSPAEPEGHVFDVETSQLARQKYSFVASDDFARALWMNFIDSKRKKEKDKDKIELASLRFNDSSHSIHTNILNGTDNHVDNNNSNNNSNNNNSNNNSDRLLQNSRGPGVSHTPSSILPSGLASHTSFTSVTPINQHSNVSHLPDQYEELFMIGDLRNNISSSNFFGIDTNDDPKIWKTSTSNNIDTTTSIVGSDCDSSSGSSHITTPDSHTPRKIDCSESDILEAQSYSLFRSCIMRTQMVASLIGQLSPNDFAPILSRLRAASEIKKGIKRNIVQGSKELHTSSKSMVNCFLNSTISGFLWHGGTVLGLMDRISTEATVTTGTGSKYNTKFAKSEYSAVIAMLEEGQLLNEIAAQKQSGDFSTTPTDTDDSVGSSDDEGSPVGSITDDKIGKIVYCSLFMD